MNACTLCSDSILNCIECTSGPTCTRCVNGFFVNSTNQCQPCTQGCIACDPTGCTQCAPTLSLDSSKNCICPITTFYNTVIGICDSCNVITGCAQCSSSTVCDLCAVTYFKSGNICEFCQTSIPNCA